MNDCGDIIEPFIKFEYSDSLKNIKDGISMRMNMLRNNVTNANLDLNVNPIHLKDLKIMQVLIYVMRLKALGMEKIKIQQSIEDLFEFNILIK